MIKYITVLTKSAKNGGYCVAGIDEISQQMIRLVSNDKCSNGALTDDDILYENGSYMEVFDKITVEVSGNENLWYQPENFLINRCKYFGYRGKATVEEIQKTIMHPTYIFYDSKKSLEPEEIKKQTYKVSLQFVEVPTMVLRIDNFNKNRITINFLYNETWYEYIKLTDIELTRRYYDRVNENGHLTLHDVLVIFSLAGAFGFDGKHYKLIANIIEKQDIAVSEVAVTIQGIEWDYDDDLPF